jgi:hypothetical protein
VPTARPGHPAGMRGFIHGLLGALVSRPAVLMGALYGAVEDAGESLHPDGRRTYEVHEWWEKDEAVMQCLWNTRRFKQIGELAELRTKIALHRISDRIGNFAVFKRHSSWRLDSKTDPATNERWVRAVSDSGEEPGGALTLLVRFIDGNETVREQLLDLPPAGVSVHCPHDYGAMLLALYEKDTGTLLAREHGSLMGGGNVRMGAGQTQVLTDSKGKQHTVEWTHWDGPPLDAINPDRPWQRREQRRPSRNLQLREHEAARLFDDGQRADVLEHLRSILAAECGGFLYLWDPYFNEDVCVDILQWLNPDVKCRILCGGSLQAERAHRTTPPSAAGLPEVQLIARGLATLRNGPPSRTVECKHRVYPKANGRFAPYYHDRFLITDGSAWILGSSLNSLGNKIASVVRLVEPDRLRWMFDDEWAAAPPANVAESTL